MVSSIGNGDMLVGGGEFFCAKRGKFVYRREEGVGGSVEEERRGIINPFYPTTQPSTG